MRVISVQLCLLSLLVFTYAHDGKQKHEELKSKGAEYHVSPLGSGEHSFVDITPNVVATIESGASPITVANSLRDQNRDNFPPSSKWPIPQSAIDFQSYLNQTANNATKPTGAAQVSLSFPPAPALMDPQTAQPAVPSKPNKPLLVYQLLGNFQKPNNTLAAFFATPSSTIAPDTNSSSVMNDPPPNPLQGLVNAPLSSFGNATNIAQELTNQLGTGGWLAGLGNRPSNDEAASGSSTSGSSNPIQSLIDNTQSSWNNATGAAQNLAGQFGSNVQNGISNIFGINLNRPSNDEPVSPSTEDSTPTVEATSSEPSSSTETSSEASSTAASSSEASASSEGTTTEETPDTTNTTDPTSSSGASFPLVSFVNNTQSFNGSSLAQGVASQLAANLPFGFPALLFQKPTRTIDVQQDRLLEPADEQPVNDPPPPARATCPTCPNTCASPQRILGGANVNPPNKYPWVVLITYSNSPNGQGALINDRTVVTTATIVKSMPINSNIRVLIGLYNKNMNSAATTKMVSNKYVHPGYNSNNLYEDNIGLLVLMGPLTSFTPICLPANVPEAPPDPKAIVMGWGATSPTGPESTILQEVELQMYPNIICGLASPLATPKNLCGGASSFFTGFAATCRGDGGDPLVVKRGTTYDLIGIALDIPGARCGMPNPPSMFTNIKPYLSWIATNGPGCRCYMSG